MKAIGGALFALGLLVFLYGAFGHLETQLVYVLEGVASQVQEAVAGFVLMEFGGGLVCVIGAFLVCKED